MAKEKFNKNLLKAVKELGDNDYELMLLGWMRYCLGRRSYIVGAAERNIIYLIPYLSDWCLNNIENDLESYANDVENGLHSWGDTTDKESWNKVWDALVVEMNKRGAIDE